MPEIAVSVLSVPKENAVSIFYNLETAKIDYFHIDVMDGKFVENDNLKLMEDYALTLSHISNVGLDVHLMVQNVEEVMDYFIELEPKIISFHYEAIQDKDRIMNIIEELKFNGIKASIAINPETPMDTIKDFLPFVHQVLIMTVVPGRGGQALIPETVEKIREVKNYINANHLDLMIEADGGINDTNALTIKQAGGDILVSGNYIISSENYKEVIQKLRGNEK